MGSRSLARTVPRHELREGELGFPPEDPSPARHLSISGHAAVADVRVARGSPYGHGSGPTTTGPRRRSSDRCAKCRQELRLPARDAGLAAGVERIAVADHPSEVRPARVERSAVPPGTGHSVGRAEGAIGGKTGT